MRTIFFLLFAALFPTLASAASFEVAPTTFNLPADGRFAALYVTNRGTQAVSAQIEAFDWQQEGASDKLTPSDALMVSPPMVKLLPGHKQTVRLAINPGANSNKEHAFRLIVSELPSAEAKPSDGVQVLLQFSVPVFVAAAEKSPPSLEWNVERDRNGLQLISHNTGNHHAKLSSIAVATPSGKDITVASGLNYVLPDMTHSWKLTLPAATPGEALKITAQDENDGAIHASVLIPR